MLTGTSAPSQSGSGSNGNESLLYIPQMSKIEALQSDSLVSCQGGARGVMVIVVGNGHGNTSSNPGRDWLHFT